MKIAMISTPFLAVPPRDYGGTELVVHELTEGLVARGHEVTLFATGDSTTSAELRWLYPKSQWPPDVLDDINHVTWAYAQIAEEGFDLVHVHSAPGLTCTRFVPLPPTVYTIHHVKDEELSAFYRFLPEVQYVAISADQASREERLPHLAVIHHGIDAAEYEWTDQPADYLVFLARLAEIKGPHTAIEVASAAGLPIRVAGEVHDEDAEFGEQILAPLLERPHVADLGNIGMEEKVPLLRDARALLVPITWNEPFGLSMIEAMLSGCPVIAFACGSVPELVEDGITGYIVRDRREMEEVVRPGGVLDGFDRRRCRERAVERFGREPMVKRYEALFQEVIERVSPLPRGAR